MTSLGNAGTSFRALKPGTRCYILMTDIFIPPALNMAARAREYQLCLGALAFTLYIRLLNFLPTKLVAFTTPSNALSKNGSLLDRPIPGD